MQLPPVVMVPNPVSVTWEFLYLFIFYSMQLPPVVMVPNPVSVTLGIPPFLYLLQYAVASGGNGTKSCVSDFGNSSISLFLTVCSCHRW